METRELFLAAAQHTAPNVFDDTKNRASKRAEKLATELRARASNLLDAIFKQCPDDPSRRSEEELTLQHRFRNYQPHCIKRGEIKIFITPDGSGEGPNYVKEITRRWVEVEVFAEDEFEQFVQDSCSVKKKILVGIDDMRFSQDGGQTWGESERAAGLEVITRLVTVGITEYSQRELDDHTMEDPFEDGPVFRERLQHEYYPVFSDEEISELGFADPVQRLRSSPYALIEGMNAALDDVLTALHEDS